MKKTFITIALIVLAIGITISFSIQVQSHEEVLADEWNPITPSKLEPNNATYLAFIDRAKAYSSEKFPKLNITALELNISASNPVRVRIGKIIPEPTGEFNLTNVIFDNSKTRFTERIQINGTDVDFLEIKNEGAKSVNISGNVKTIGETVRTSYPYLNIGTTIVLTGLALLIYGLMAKPKKPRKILASTIQKPKKASLLCASHYMLRQGRRYIMLLKNGAKNKYGCIRSEIGRIN